jgi:hypothetical protein
VVVYVSPGEFWEIASKYTASFHIFANLQLFQRKTDVDSALTGRLYAFTTMFFVVLLLPDERNILRQFVVIIEWNVNL